MPPPPPEPPEQTLENIIAAFEWIMRNRIDPENGRLVSASAITEQAGYSRQLADSIMGRRQKSVGSDVIRAIARKWNVRIHWIVTGKPPIEPFDEMEGPDLYPVRARTIAYARDVGGFPEAALQRLAEHQLTDDRSANDPDYWMDLLRVFRAEAVGRPPSVPPPPAEEKRLPKTWPGWEEIAVALINNETTLNEFGTATVGFGDTPTAIDQPQPFNAETVRPHVEKFLLTLGKRGQRGRRWEEWRKVARDIYDRANPPPPSNMKGKHLRPAGPKRGN